METVEALSLESSDSGLHLVAAPAPELVPAPKKKRVRKPSALVRAQKAHSSELTLIRQETAQALESQKQAFEAQRLALESRLEQAAKPVELPIEEPAPKRMGAAVVGGIALGMFVPLAAHTLVHAPEFNPGNHVLWLVVACLVYSAPTVCAWAGSFTVAGATHWAEKSLGWLKAAAFVGCLEGILVAAPASCAWLSHIALALLMGINAVILAAKFRKA